MFKMEIEGRVAREVRIGVNAKTGSKVVNATIAVDMSTTQKKATQFFDVAFWGVLADEASKLVKGQLVKAEINHMAISTSQVAKKGGQVGELATFTNANCQAVSIELGKLPQALQNAVQPNQEIGGVEAIA